MPWGIDLNSFASESQRSLHDLATLDCLISFKSLPSAAQHHILHFVERDIRNSRRSTALQGSIFTRNVQYMCHLDGGLQASKAARERPRFRQKLIVCL